MYVNIREIIVVSRRTIHRACHSKWKNDLFKKNRKLKAAFFRSKAASPARSNSLAQMRLLVRLKLFLCYSHFCTTAKQSALTLSQAFSAMLEHQRCVHVQGTLSSHPVARQKHRRSIKDVYMSKECYHPIP